MNPVTWILIGLQMLTWAWFSLKAGNLSDRQFLLFTAGMMAGQVGAGVETYFNQAWATFASQVFYLCFTAYAGYQRLVKIGWQI